MFKPHNEFKYHPMTHQEFSRALDGTGLSMSQLARQLGINPSDVREMLRGERDIPHIIRIVMFLLESQERAPAMTRQLTDAVLEFTDEHFKA